MNILTRTLIALYIYVTFLLAAPVFAEEVPSIEAPDWNAALYRLVTEHRESLGLVGLGAMIMQDEEVIASAVAGERKHRSGALLTDQDKWHIGSITKSFTATMIARLVERGELTWDTTIGDVFADSTNISESWQSVTVEQLLTHTSGASNDLKFPWSYFFRKASTEGSTRMEAREVLILKFMIDEPVSPPSDKFLYSNPGYIIAGAMAEKITGLPWEELIRNEIFTPLGIQSGGFGSPKDHDRKLEQPRGHKSVLGFIVSVESDINPLVVGPAGTIHIALNDLLVYANEHLQGKSGQGKLLKAKTYQYLHKPKLHNYAYGWAVKHHEEWANGTTIWHNGSNGHWYAMLAILPDSNAIIAVTSNDRRQYSGNEITRPILEGAAQLLNDAKILNSRE